MGLIKCPDCGKELNEDVKVCPKCGCPNEKSKKSKKNILIGLCFILLGIFSFILAANLGYYGMYENLESYGGDAYTGIQNAAATAANNINELGNTLCLGFQGIIGIMGIAFILYGLKIMVKEGK